MNRDRDLWRSPRSSIGRWARLELATSLLVLSVTGGCGSDTPTVPGEPQCGFQCSVAEDCLLLLAQEEPELPEGSRFEGEEVSAWNEINFDRETCVTRCEWISSSEGSSRSCARETWAAMEAGASGDIPIDDTLLVCEDFLGGDCPVELYSTQYQKGSPVGECGHTPPPRSGLGLGLAVAALLIAGKRGRGAGVILLLLCPVARAQDVDVGTGSISEIAVGTGFVEPVGKAIRPANFIPVYGARKTHYNRVDPGPYYGAALSLDSATITDGFGSSGGLFGFDFRYLTSALYHKATDDVLDEAEADGNRFEQRLITGGLRIRLGEVGYWSNSVTRGRISGFRFAAVDVPGVAVPYFTWLSTDEVIPWEGSHIRITSAFRMGFWGTETIRIGPASMTRERPMVLELGFVAERMDMPVVDLTRLDHLRKDGFTFSVNSDPALNFDYESPVDYYFEIRIGAGRSEIKDITFPGEQPLAAPYLETGFQYGLCVIPIESANGHWYLRLGQFIEQTTVFKPDPRGTAGVRSMLTVGHLQ